MVFGNPIRQKYNRVTRSDLREIDRCLGLTRGDRRAAAAVLGLGDEQLRNLINTHDCLKSKWGRHAAHRPREIDFVKAVVRELTPAARCELAEWLAAGAPDEPIANVTSLDHDTPDQLLRQQGYQVLALDHAPEPA